MPDNAAIAHALAAELQKRERERAEGLPDTSENALIRRLLAQPNVWTNIDRLQNLQRLASSYHTRPGAFVECGVAAGASLAMMAAYAGERTVWGFDSFEPLPPLTEADEGDGELFVGVKNSGPLGELAVTETFNAVGVPMDRTRVVKGWFSDTLPGLVEEIGPIAILRLDADWYEATRFALDTLYPSMLPGGVVIVDDYGSFVGCRTAIDEFRATRKCEELRHTSDGIEAYWYA